MNATTDTRPIVAITMGDASGIGPEIIMKALARDDVAAICRPLVIGDATRLREAGAIVHSTLTVDALLSPAEAHYARGTVGMMLVAPKLRVIHVTTHVGLMDAIRRIEPALVERVISRGRATLVKSGISDPRIGVCGINPHAGEHGLFGQGEEEEKIIPAVQACQAKGWKVDGPLPADTLFFRAARGDFDLVVAMYHDQGHGPVKVTGLEAGVNVTIGLPVVRTSVDHGTAFDIAGTGVADERSLVEALRQAVNLAPRRA